MLAQVRQRRVTYLQNAGNTSVQGVAVEIAVRMATLAVVLALFTASAVCSTCSSENITLLSPVPAPTLASSLCDETMKVSDVMTVYRCNLWELVPECQIIDSRVSHYYHGLIRVTKCGSVPKCLTSVNECLISVNLELD